MDEGLPERSLGSLNTGPDGEVSDGPGGGYWNIMLTDSLRWMRLIAWPSRLATDRTVIEGSCFPGERGIESVTMTPANGAARSRSIAGPTSRPWEAMA